MVQEDLFALFNALASERGALLYAGAFPDEHTARLIDIAEQTLAMEDGGGKSARARTTFALIEAYQNIVRHRMVGSSGRELLVMAHGKAATSIVTANNVADHDLPGLRNALDRLEGLDTDALKRLFLSILNTGTTTARGGAGLGFIEMTRRTGNPLGHRIVPISAGLYRFQLLVNCAGIDPTHTMAWVDELDRLTKATGALLAIGGTEWSTVVEKRALLLLDDGPHVDATILSRAALAALQVLHGARVNGTPAMLVCRNLDGASMVNVLMTLEKERCASVLEEVKNLNSAGPEERKKRYRDALLRRGGPVEGWRTGLYDLAQRADTLAAMDRDGNGRALLLIEARI